MGVHTAEIDQMRGHQPPELAPQHGAIFQQEKPPQRRAPQIGHQHAKRDCNRDADQPQQH